ncbi:hypothetical protein [Pasteuria penetrans]|uniref:hypothetical protein n=1 Tax=Pasteuria penetrans TaxID=86005 RepID=UPI0011EBC36A|nr:hypothetical protein [Pasteuria penetrans]
MNTSRTSGTGVPPRKKLNLQSLASITGNILHCTRKHMLITIILEFIKETFRWADREWIERIPRKGLFFGALEGKKEKPLIGRKTLYDGRKRLLAYEEKARCNITQGSFRHFTTFQKSIVGMISTCRRMDSTLINSNIRKLTRNEMIYLVAKKCGLYLG